MPKVEQKRSRRTPVKRSGTLKKTITTQVYGSDSEEDITVEVLDFEVEPAYVHAKLGTTKNLGDYESLRVDVSISVPCVPDPMVIDETFRNISDQAMDLLDETVDELLGEE